MGCRRMLASGFGEQNSYLCIGKNLRRDDLVGPKGLSWVYKRCQNLSRLPALACWFQLSVDVIRAWHVRHLLLIDEGSGLLRPSGILGGDAEAT